MSLVAFANFLAPILSNLKLTIDWFVSLSKPGWASIKFSPETINFFSTSAKDPSDLFLIFSKPRLSPELLLVFKNLKFNWAVFPRIFLKFDGSDNPGNSTRILPSPFC